MLRQRTITTLILLPVLLAAVWFDTPIHWFTLLMMAWGAVAVIEFYRLSRGRGIAPLLYFGTVWTLLLISTRDTAVAAFFNVEAEKISMMLLVSAVVLPLMWLLRHEPRGQAFSSWVWTLGGMAYVGILLGNFVALRTTDDGRNWVYFAFLATFASDTAAFFVGRALGKRRLAPTISPSKTWEGAIGGVAGAAIISLIFVPTALFSAANVLHIPALSSWSAVLLGIAVSVFGQIGDLVESLLKRNMDAKDSGKLFPGHGGALDRLDSVAFAGVVIYYFVWLTR